MSANDDDLSKTMVIPNPGGRRASAPLQTNPPPTRPIAPAQSVLDIPIESASEAGVLIEELPTAQAENLLLANASDLINLASNIRTLEPNNSAEQLRFDINSHIERFNIKLAEQGLTNEVALTARYLMCCLIDELVLSTPWGIESTWSRQTLLSKYHNETSGGEKFFIIINKLMGQPQRNIDLIELCYLCLSIGFRGKYRVSPTGESDILQLCNMMHQAIAMHRPIANELSPSWRVDTEQQLSLEKKLPPSLVFLLLVFICVAAYIGLLSNLHAQSSGLFEKIESIAWDQTATSSSASISPSNEQAYADIKNKIEQDLQTAIAQGLIEIVRQNDMLSLRFISDELFASGSIQVNENQLPQRENLLSVMQRYTDAIVIVGHTDSTGRAESNWAISRERAESIETWLKGNSKPSLQIVTRGVADTQPISENPRDSRNRRVEILIFLQEDKSNG